MPEPIGRYITVDGFRTYYESSGEGRPILCIHSAGADGREYRHFAMHFSGAYRVVALDMPGHGKSYPDLERGELLRDSEAWARFIVQVIDALALERPVLVGCAMSANLALEVAARYGSSLSAVVAAEGVASTAGAVGDLFLDMLNHPQINVADFMEAQTLGLIGRTIPAAAANECIWHNARGLTPEVVQRDIAIGYLDYDIRPLLGDVDVPVLLTRGEWDWVVTRDQSEATHAGLRRSELVELDGVGHFPMLEDPPGFNAVVERFLMRVAPPLAQEATR